MLPMSGKYKALGEAVVRGAQLARRRMGAVVERVGRDDAFADVSEVDAIHQRALAIGGDAFARFELALFPTALGLGAAAHAQQTTLRVFSGGANQRPDLMRKLFDQYQAKNAGIKIDIETGGATSELQRQAVGIVHDVIHMKYPKGDVYSEPGRDSGQDAGRLAVKGIGMCYEQLGDHGAAAAALGFSRKLWIGVPSVDAVVMLSHSAQSEAGVKPDSRASACGSMPRMRASSWIDAASFVPPISTTNPAARPNSGAMPGSIIEGMMTSM